MARFVLIHGGGHGGWCWERIVPLLEAAGHDVITPDLPGLGDDHTPPSEVTVEAWGRRVADVIGVTGEPVILVGHSFGGMAVSQGAEYAPQRVRRLVYVAALLPQDGQSAMDLMAGADPAAEAPATRMTPSADGQLLDIDNPREAFYGLTEEAWADRAISRLRPQPAAIVADPARLTRERFGAIPRTYVETLDDRAMPLRVQRRMQAASPCQTVAAIASDHSPFYSAPRVLTDHLLAAASEGAA